MWARAGTHQSQQKTFSRMHARQSPLLAGEKEPKPAAVLHKAALCPYVVTSGGNHAPTEQGIVLCSYFSLDFSSLLPFHNFYVARGFAPEFFPDVVDARFERRH